MQIYSGDLVAIATLLKKIHSGFGQYRTGLGSGIHSPVSWQVLACIDTIRKRPFLNP